jgi:hypothetical protein
MENTPDFRVLKYEYSLRDFWKLKFLLESRTKINSARMEDEHERLLQLQAGK